MARQRTQKTISVRIDGRYINRLAAVRRVRRLAVFGALAGAILFLALTQVGGRGESIHNPGQLTRVHASFQNNCAACHDGCDAQGKPTSKFSLAVSDSACLRCHDAGVHNANQSTQVVMDMSRHPPEVRSADCASCHVEHRGQSALISNGDMQCLSCHSDLSGKTVKPPVTPVHMTDFTVDGHPQFGRELRRSGTLVDPTDLRFNHKKHLGILKGEQQNCTFCHNPDPDAARDLVWETGKTAYAIPGGAGAAPIALADGTSRHRSLTQVNFAKNCQSCHDLGTLPGSDIPIPHEDLALLRRLILTYVTSSSSPWLKMAPDKTGPREKALNDRIISALNVPSDYSDAVDAVTKAVKADPLSARANLLAAPLPADVEAKLIAAAAKLPANIVPAAEKSKVTSAVASTTQPAMHLRPLVISRLRDAAVAGRSGAEKQKILAEFDAVFARYNQDTPDPRLIEMYVVYANDAGVSCVKCHDVEGDAAGVPSEWTSLSSPLKTPAASVFQTKPTGIPASPRRWYVNSEFNHDAHRIMNCVECHTAALSSEKTSDILSPDIQWQGLRFKPGSMTEMEAAQRSCVECHHPDNSQGPGAASNCTECHVYHDRSHEQLSKPTPPDVLSGKVPPASPQASASG